MVRTLEKLSRRALAHADAAMNRVYGWRYNPVYHSGAVVVALLIVLIATGVYLLLFYRIGSPYASMTRITDQVWLGRWIRGMHRYAADAALVATGVHALRMFAQRKSWGPRVLAWTSGLVMVFVFFVCAWTGYVLVWDAQAQLLATAGARLLDLLPIFSEPISRTFVGERPMPDAFFFINFFLHVALPLGVGLILWMHIARVARPVLVPPRPVTWSVVGALFALSVLWPIRMDPPADLLRLPGRTELDVFYGFWLPLVDVVPAWALWAAFLAVATGLLLVPVASRPGRGELRPPPSVVDERACTGCEQCYHDCPYEAISMVERTDGRAGLVARVDDALCVSCGICSASCAPMVVGPPGRTGREQLAATRLAVASAPSMAGEIVLVACDKGSGGVVGEAPIPGVRMHRVGCAGSLHTSVIEYYLRAGAAGVMVVACPPRDCWNREGGKWVRERMFEGREAELQARVDRERVHLAFAGAAERDLVLEELRAFRERLEPAPEGDTEIDLIALCVRAEETVVILADEEDR